MVKNVTADPLQVGLFGPQAVMFGPDAVPDLVEQSRGLDGHGGIGVLRNCSSHPP